MSYHDGWDLFWMVPMMLLFVILVALAVYAAVRIGNEDSRQRGRFF